MDLAKQTALVEHARARGGDSTQVAVTLEQFFDGNDCEWCIAPNRDEAMPLETVRRVLFDLRERPEVHDVRVELDVLEFQSYPDDEWPYASGVAVITTLTPEEVDAMTVDAETEPMDDVIQTALENREQLLAGVADRLGGERVVPAELRL